MSDKKPDIDVEVPPSPFAGLLRTSVNPAVMPPTPPAKAADPEGHFPVVLSVRVPTRVRELAKRNALLRGMSMQDYIAMLIERDAKP